MKIVKNDPLPSLLQKGIWGNQLNATYVKSAHFNPKRSNSIRIRNRCQSSSFYHIGLAEADPYQAQQQTRGTRIDQLECSVCNLTFEKFLDIGKFGCATCYDAFRERLPHVLGKLHSGHQPIPGKYPVSFNELYAVKRKIEEVRTKMQEAVENERFEEAATLRDEAKALQHHLANGGEESDVD